MLSLPKFTFAVFFGKWSENTVIVWSTPPLALWSWLGTFSTCELGIQCRFCSFHPLHRWVELPKKRTESCSTWRFHQKLSAYISVLSQTRKSLDDKTANVDPEAGEKRQRTSCSSCAWTLNTRKPAELNSKKRSQETYEDPSISIGDEPFFFIWLIREIWGSPTHLSTDQHDANCGVNIISSLRWKTHRAQMELSQQEIFSSGLLANWWKLRGRLDFFASCAFTLFGLNREPSWPALPHVVCQRYVFVYKQLATDHCNEVTKLISADIGNICFGWCALNLPVEHIITPPNCFALFRCELFSAALVSSGSSSLACPYRSNGGRLWEWNEIKEIGNCAAAATAL